MLTLLQDGALDRGLVEALVESRQRYKDLVEISSDFAWETDCDGRFVFVSLRGALGWEARDLLGREVAHFLLDADRAAMFRTKVPTVGEEIWFRRRDGDIACLGIAATPVVDAAGEWRGARGLCRDVTETRRRERDLAQARLRDRLLTHIVRVMRDELDPEAALAAAIAATGLALGAVGGTIMRGPGAAEMKQAVCWGEPAPQAAVAAIVATLCPAPEASIIEPGLHIVGYTARCRSAVQGALVLWQHEESGGFPEPDRALLADVADYLGVAIAQLASIEHILSLSRTDPLTGLFNRRAFLDELERRLVRRDHAASETAADAPGALFYLDADNFKLVNDRRGHAAGDDVLRAIATILGDHSRAGDLLARFGGDEFVMWIEGIDRAQAIERAEAVQAVCTSLAGSTGDPQRPLGISIGIDVADAPRLGDAAQLLARADAALYAAKAAGKGRYEVASAPRAKEERA